MKGMRLAFEGVCDGALVCMFACSLTTALISIVLSEGYALSSKIYAPFYSTWCFRRPVYHRQLPTLAESARCSSSPREGVKAGTHGRKKLYGFASIFGCQ